MTNMGVNEAANAIRGVFYSDQSTRSDPAYAHQLKFVKDVTTLLGAEPTPENVAHVGTLLREAGIALPSGQEFPKYAVRDWDKTSKIVHSEQEEKEWVEEAQSDLDTGYAALREQTQPVQDLSLDLSKQVPQHVDYTETQPLKPVEVTGEQGGGDEIFEGDEVHVEDVDTSHSEEVSNEAADAAAGKQPGRGNKRPV